MPAPTLFGTPVQAGTPSGTTLTINKPVDVEDGDLLVAIIRAQGTVASEITKPTGWVRNVGANGAADRAQGIFLKPVPSAIAETASNYQFGGWSTGRAVGMMTIVRGADLGQIGGSGVGYVIGNPGSYGHTPPHLVLAAWGDERTAGWSHVPSVKPAGYTDVINIQSTLDASTTGSRTGLYVGQLSVAEGGSQTIDAASLTWPTGTTATRSNSTPITGLLTPNPIGVPVENGTGATVWLSYLDDGLVRRAPTLVGAWIPGFTNVTQLLAKPGATIAHRGGSLNWPEMSEYAYDHAVMQGYGALEFSCGWTSDLVPFGLADQYLDRYVGMGGNIDPTTMTWETLSESYQNQLRMVEPGLVQAFYKLEDFLAKYTQTHVVTVDPKYGFSTLAKVNIMLNLCDANGGPSRIIIKFDSPTSDPVMTTAAHARGYQCMNYWGTAGNSAAMAAQQSNWDIIGARYDDATMMAQANTYGKPVWAAVVPSVAGYNTSMVNNADFVMCSDVALINPVSSWN